MKRLLSLMLAAMLLFALAAVPTVAEGSDPTGAISPDIKWYSAEKTEFELRTAAEVLGFLQLAQTEANFAHKTVRLTADIHLNPGTELCLKTDAEGKYTLPAKPANVWNGLPSWKGIFDGNGHVLSGVYVEVDCSGSYGRASMFGIISEGTVKNLIVENSFICAKNVKTGLPNDGSEGSSAAGIARRLQYGATVENLWLDMDVVTVGWSGGETAGVAARVGDGSNIVVRNVAFAGTVAALHSEDLSKATSSDGMAVSQIVANQMWKMALSIDNAALLGTSICNSAVNGNLPICKNSKLSEINSHAIFGKHLTVEEAKAANQYWDYPKTTTVDFTYSVFAGGVIPTAVSGMLRANAIRVVGVQRSDATYTAGDGNGAYTAQSLRFVAAIRLTGEQLGAFEKAGFLIQIKENGTDSYLIREGATVYTSITANNATVTAGEYDADYLVALSVKNVPVGSEIELVITPYLTDAGATKWAGTPVSAKVLASGAFDSEN